MAQAASTGRQLVDGVVALPAGTRTRERFDWLADEVVQAGGEATIWLGRAASAEQDRSLVRRMAQAVAVDYQAVAKEAAETSSPRTLARLRRELHRISRRDPFPPPERESAREAVNQLAQRLAVEEESSR